MAAPLLELRDVSHRLRRPEGRSTASTSTCDEGEIVSVIGPNGAGKTTLFNLVTGIYEPDARRHPLRGREHRRPRAAPDHAARDRAHVPDAAPVPEHERARERDGGGVRPHARRASSRSMLRTPGMRREEREIRELAEERLSFFGERLMGYRWDQPAYSLSYANRRRLEIARAMATKPRLLLLDEPAAGMNPVETHEITELIAKLRDEGGYTILVIEHDMHVVEGISDRVDRARPRRQDRRGLVRAGRDRPAGRRGLPRHEGGGDEMSEPSRRPPPLLELEGVNTFYGQIHILQGLKLEVRAGELVCLLGGNASGKSTTLKTILGIVRPRNGRRHLRRRGRDARTTSYRIGRGHGDRAREPAAVRADDRAREPRDGRVPPRRRRRRRTSTASTRSSRCCTSAARSSRGRSRAASSRWSRWAAR